MKAVFTKCVEKPKEPSAPPNPVQGYNTSSTSIFVSWGVVLELDQNGVILSYTVTYEALPPSPALTVAKTVSAPNRSITLDELNEFTDYSITVFASTVKGGGNISAPITVRTDEDKPSAPPTPVQAYNTSSTSIFVSWGVVSELDQNGVILSYTVTYEALPPSPALKVAKTVSAPNRSITLDELNEFTDYSITVFASTVKGGGNISAPITVKTDEDKPSALPTPVQGYNTSSTSIFVSWGVVSVLDQNGVILSYTVTYEALPPSPALKVAKTVSAPNTSTTLEDLNEFTDYNITVFASTVKGGGNISAPITVRTDEDKPSAPPTLVQGSKTSSTSIFVSWGEVPVLDQNGVILSYTVTYEIVPPSPGLKVAKSVSAPNTSITLEDLNEFTNYIITVFASTVKGGGNISTPITVRTEEDKPSAPPTPVQGYNTSSTSIFVSWGVVSELDQNGVILSYTVTYEALPPSPALTVAKTVSAPNRSITLEDLNEFNDYSITVFASTVKGGGNISAPITVRTDEDKPSAPPTPVQGYNTSSTIIFVSWGVVSVLDQNGVILSYTVTYEALPPSPALKVAKTEAEISVPLSL
ncbi:phosphatidylinositol phosphatase PTPRQ-like [Montipora foliosa]|uniref:phosphatidylinositol phosphatase PTPRQ-like n=1 Tax=Montipora foliosa TaxID=591990 RepID=UPI0035F11384